MAAVASLSPFSSVCVYACVCGVQVRLVAGKAVGAFALACCRGYGATPGAVQTVEMSLVPTLQAMAADTDMDAKSVAKVTRDRQTDRFTAEGPFC